MQRITSLLVAALVLASVLGSSIARADVYPSQPANLPTASVLRVIDGDTLDVSLTGRTERLRLIGIDTPETKDPRKPVQCFGQAASDRAATLLTGKTVALEADPSQDTRDRYDRLLMYVWVGGRLYNLDMIADGYAHEYTYETPYKYQAAFKAAERGAREGQRGFWSPATCNGDTTQPATTQNQPQQDQRCFPETGQCIAGRFRQYWEQNGGLPVFGFPITPAQDERNPDTGQTYLTQWFERNRFERHPEHAAPYDVLLGRLGDDRLRQLGRNWQTFPKGQQIAGCLWFAETGHSVCEPFKSYWETHGLLDPALNRYARSLALFGLPLSERVMETNTSGDTVETQWFERARFECHPNNPPEYRVLLGLLGNEVRQNSAIPAAKPAVTCTVTTPPPPPAPPAPSPPLPPPSFNGCQDDPNPASAPEFPVRIMSIDKAAETVVLRNVSTTAVDLSGWHVCSITGNQEHQGIGGLLAASQTRTFPRANPDNIWNNSERDDGALYDAQGRLIDYYFDDGR